MKSFKKILFLLFLTSITESVFGSTTSHVTNNTNKAFLVYWTAAGCAGTHNGVTEVCKHEIVSPHKTGEYKFKGSQSYLQIKVSSRCEWNRNIYFPLFIVCPSGPWFLNGGRSAKTTCKLYGKGRGHVKNVTVSDFSGRGKLSNSCTKVPIGRWR